MHVPPGVSDAAVDEVVEALFILLPAMSDDDMLALMNVVLKILGREVQRVVQDERRAFGMMLRPCRQ